MDCADGVAQVGTHPGQHAGLDVGRGGEGAGEVDCGNGQILASLLPGPVAGGTEDVAGLLDQVDEPGRGEVVLRPVAADDGGQVRREAGVEAAKAVAAAVLVLMGGGSSR